MVFSCLYYIPFNVGSYRETKQKAITSKLFITIKTFNCRYFKIKDQKFSVNFFTNGNNSFCLKISITKKLNQNLLLELAKELN